MISSSGFRNWKPTEDISVSVDEEPPAEQEAIQHISQYFKDKIYEGNMRHYAERDIEIWNESSPMDFPIMQLYVKAPATRYMHVTAEYLPRRR